MEVNLKPCPFCGGAGKLITETGWFGYSSYTWENVLVRCQECTARSKQIYKKTLAEFTNHTVREFRDNPALRARVEDEYENYIKDIEILAVTEWESRI